jgi:hypothetical protein
MILGAGKEAANQEMLKEPLLTKELMEQAGADQDQLKNSFIKTGTLKGSRESLIQEKFENPPLDESLMMMN